MTAKLKAYRTSYNANHGAIEGVHAHCVSMGWGFKSDKSGVGFYVGFCDYMFVGIGLDGRME
jgi:hypothetical protein